MYEQYGLISPLSDSCMMSLPEGQAVGGYTIGIVYVENIWFPVIPGNVLNASTYKYPVYLLPVKGLGNRALFTGAEELYQGVKDACLELKKVGARAITGACGFFGNFQTRLAAELDVPVAMSSLVQLPWIMSMLKPGQKVGVLTACAEQFGENLLNGCGIAPEIQERLEVIGFDDTDSFKNIIDGKGFFDNAKMKELLVGRSVKLCEDHPEIGAILLECTEMPPYAYLIQAATRKPVFDFITLIDWMHSGVCRQPFIGYM